MKLRILLLAFVAVLFAPVEAHELPPEVRMYFRIQGQTLHVLARLPLATLSDASLPLTPTGAIDLEQGRPKLAAAAADFVRNADLMDGEASLAPGPIDWRVSNQDNLAFMSYEIADAYLRAAPGTPGEAVDARRGFLDLRVDYLLRSGAPALQARVNTARIGGAFVPTRATYVTGDGDVRQFFVRGAPSRVAFEPTAGAAAARFAGLGAARVALERILLLFLFVLAVPRRSMTESLTLLAFTLGGYASAAVVVLYSPALDARVTGLAALASAALLAVAALQNFTAVRPGWTGTVACLLGLSAGVGAGAVAHEMISFAGSYKAVGVLLFVTVAAAGCTAAFAGFQAVTALASRLPITPRAAVILLSLLPLHTALHALAVEGAALAGLPATDAGGAWTSLLRYWPPLAAVFGVVILAGIRALARGAVVEHPEAG